MACLACALIHVFACVVDICGVSSKKKRRGQAFSRAKPRRDQQPEDTSRVTRESALSGARAGAAKLALVAAT